MGDTVVVGHDNNGVNDSEDQDYLCSKLEEAGYTVEKLSIGPNYFASYSYGENGEKPSGKIGVYMMADSLVSVADYAYGAALGTSFKYAYFVIRGDLDRPKMDSRDDFNNNPIGRDSDCTSVCDKLAGKTYPQMNDECKDKCWIVFGVDKEERAKELLKAMGGQFTEDGGEGSTGSTIKDALKQAVGGDGTNGWDGEAEIRIEGDTVYVNRIPDPTTTKLVANEYTNVQYDSVTITDLNPQTPNKITMEYEGQTLVLKDDHMIERFEENPVEVEPDEFVKSYDDAVSFLQRQWNKIRRGDGRQVELKVQGNMKWKTGVWVRVYLPSFLIDDYMYVVRCSQDEDGTGNWTASLTLEDYPPSLGLYTGGATEEEEDTEEEDTEDTDENKTDDENTESTEESS